MEEIEETSYVSPVGQNTSLSTAIQQHHSNIFEHIPYRCGSCNAKEEMFERQKFQNFCHLPPSGEPRHDGGTDHIR